MRCICRGLVTGLLLGSLLSSIATAAEPARKPPLPRALDPNLDWIDTSIENASPLWYEAAPDGAILLHLLYDHERSSPNRAAGHIHFLLHGKPGATITLEFLNLDNVWNGQHGSVAKELNAVAVSENGRDWRPMATQALPGDRVRLAVTMPGPRVYVARVEPYRISDLDRLLTDLRGKPLVEITPIGKTVQGRPLEIVRVGRADAPFRVFLRARAHAWEAGGNWVVEGLLRRLVETDDEAKAFLNRYAVYVLPMANKDGVARGGTRFNSQGKDLNRNWDKPADPRLAPENAALETWLEGMIRAGKRPNLALDFHNDGGGQLNFSRAALPDIDRRLARMATLESLLRRHTWFTEGSATQTVRTPATLGDGWLVRYHIDAAIHELNCDWIAGLNDHPSAKHWQSYGRTLARVFYEYFGGLR